MRSTAITSIPSNFGVDVSPLQSTGEKNAKIEGHTKLVRKVILTHEKTKRYGSKSKRVGRSYDSTPWIIARNVTSINNSEKFDPSYGLTIFLHLGAEEKERELIVKLLNSPSPNHQIQRIVNDINDLGYEECAKAILLLNEIEDLEEGDLPLQIESVRGLLSLFQKFKELKNLGEPVLGLFPEGTLSVGWRIADNKHLLVEPLDSDNVCFAMIAPSDDSPDGKTRLSDKGRIKDIVETLRGLKVNEWR